MDEELRVGVRVGAAAVGVGWEVEEVEWDASDGEVEGVVDREGEGEVVGVPLGFPPENVTERL